MADTAQWRSPFSGGVDWPVRATKGPAVALLSEGGVD